MLKGKIPKDEFYKKYGGQRYRGIVTPVDYPYIYLIYSKGKYEHDNIDVDGDGTHNRVYFSSEGEGLESIGNRAIIEHENRKGVYNSLLLFRLDSGEIEYIGEYYLERVHRNPENGNILYFELVKTFDLDQVPIYYVGEKTGEENRIFLIGDREDYFTNKISESEEQAHVFQGGQEEIEGSYVDANYALIQESDSVGRGARPEEKKVAQHKKILEMYNRKLRKQMKRYARERKSSIATSDEEEQNINCKGILYCVNVGCGLTTFLILNRGDEVQKELWCFDWGIDGNKQNEYINNIKLCLDYIRGEYFPNGDLRINKFFLSHPHLDHYGQAQVNCFRNSEIWINPYIHSASTSYINFVKELLKRTSKFVEPLSTNSGDIIIVHHPNRRIEFKYKGVPSSSNYYTSQSNNVSPILELKIGEKSIILPGDIEHQGWEWYKTAGGTSFDAVSVSVHSHHGSETGFITNIPNKDDTEYETIHSEIDFLSSRDGAYSGIVSNKIKRHTSYSRTKSTDQNGLVFYEVNLMTMQLRKKMDDGSWIDL